MIFERTESLLGADKLRILKTARVAVFGVGGVGGAVALSLARSGVGEIDVIDHDTVSLSNINRQLIAFNSTVGKNKVEVIKDMLYDINPEIKVNAYKEFYSAETEGKFDFSRYDYIADAIDTVTSKLLIIERAEREKVKIISSMGTGNKLHPELFKISDISKTSVCPLARVMRRELKKRGITSLKVLWSEEAPLRPAASAENERPAPGSVSFVPPVAGMIIAGEIIRELAGV